MYDNLPYYASCSTTISKKMSSPSPSHKPWWCVCFCLVYTQNMRVSIMKIKQNRTNSRGQIKRSVSFGKENWSSAKLKISSINGWKGVWLLERIETTSWVGSKVSIRGKYTKRHGTWMLKDFRKLTKLRQSKWVFRVLGNPIQRE